MIEKTQKSLIQWKGIISFQTESKDEELQSQKAKLTEIIKIEELLDAKINEAQKDLQNISNLNSYSKHVYITKEDLNNCTQPGEVIMLLQSPVGSTFSYCGNEDLKEQCWKYEKMVKASLVSDPNNTELKKELDEITDMKSIQQFVKIVSPSDEKIELITSSKVSDNIKASQLYTSE